MALSTQTDFYLNLNQLSGMKLAARQNSAEASQGVAQQFESLFIQQMLGAMRSAARVDGASHSSYTDFYQEMHDKQLALTMAKRGGLGLTKFIMQQLPGGQNDAGTGGEMLPLHQYHEVVKTPVIPQMNYQPENPAVIVKAMVEGDIGSGNSTTPVAAGGNWKTSKAYIEDVLPHARVAAKSLGISPGLLLAQSALETGWGKHVMTRVDGSPAFNLFGIKAGSDWSGDTVTKNTLEFRDGVMQEEVARFRAYDSVEDSMQDYVNFIQSSDRYEEALRHGGSDDHYVYALQKAGYATDPAYAEKIISILQGSHLREILKGDTSHA